MSDLPFDDPMDAPDHTVDDLEPVDDGDPDFYRSTDSTDPTISDDTGYNDTTDEPSHDYESGDDADVTTESTSSPAADIALDDSPTEQPEMEPPSADPPPDQPHDTAPDGPPDQPDDAPIAYVTKHNSIHHAEQVHIRADGSEASAVVAKFKGLDDSDTRSLVGQAHVLKNLDRGVEPHIGQKVDFWLNGSDTGLQATVTDINLKQDIFRAEIDPSVTENMNVDTLFTGTAKVGDPVQFTQLAGVPDGGLLRQGHVAWVNDDTMLLSGTDGGHGASGSPVYVSGELAGQVVGWDPDLKVNIVASMARINRCLDEFAGAAPSHQPINEPATNPVVIMDK